MLKNNQLIYVKLIAQGKTRKYISEHLMLQKKLFLGGEKTRVYSFSKCDA